MLQVILDMCAVVVLISDDAIYPFLLLWVLLTVETTKYNLNPKNICWLFLLDYVPLCDASRNSCQGEDLHVLSCGALTGEVQ